MTKSSRLALPVLVALCIATGAVRAQEGVATPGTNAVDKAEAAYAKSIEGRAREILTALSLDDVAKSSRVHDVIIAQYRALRSWHDANDANRKELAKAAATKGNENAGPDQLKVDEIDNSLRALHDGFIAKLSAELTPTQVDIVKDKMTYNKVKVTYDAYCQIVPGLTDAEKAKMLEWLKKAREEAMDCGSADEKSAVFKKYKGRINNYLSAQGHDVSKAYKDFGQQQKAKAASKAAQPAE